MRTPNNRCEDLQKIRSIADYQFGKCVGGDLFPDDVEVVKSRRTGKIRYVYSNGILLATLKARDGLFSLTYAGARNLGKGTKSLNLQLKITETAVPFVEKGGDVFAKHVIDANKGIRPMEEVIVLDQNGKLLAVGKSLLSSLEMKHFRRGVAVKVRKVSSRYIKK